MRAGIGDGHIYLMVLGLGMGIVEDRPKHLLTSSAATAKCYSLPLQQTIIRGLDTYEGQVSVFLRVRYKMYKCNNGDPC